MIKVTELDYQEVRALIAAAHAAQPHQVELLNTGGATITQAMPEPETVSPFPLRSQVAFALKGEGNVLPYWCTRTGRVYDNDGSYVCDEFDLREEKTDASA